jgi:hypothetical protein
MTEGDIIEILRKRYAPEEWCFLSGVRKAVGFSHGGVTRTADAVAMGMYPSRGLSLVGFEIKVSRSDWLRELKDPAKAEAIFRFMNHWFIVAPAGMVKKDELPGPWGLISVNEQGEARVSVQAPKLAPDPIPRTFWASLFREAMRQASQDAEVRRRLEPMLASELEQCRKDWQRTFGYELSQAEQSLDIYKKKYESIVAALGGDNYDARIVEVCQIARQVIKGEQSVKLTMARLQSADIALREALDRVAWAKKEIDDAGNLRRTDGQVAGVCEVVDTNQLL